MVDTELIQLKGVTKRFRRNLVLDSIDLAIPEKEITGIVGATGEGKTTILQLIMGFTKPNRGEVLYLRRNILRDFKNVKKVFGFATEDGSFYENLTVKENIFHFGRLYKMKRSEIKGRSKEILEFVGLTSAVKTQAKNLSIGMKKRLDIACAIIHKPEILIMDEPTADLDPLLRAQMLSLIKKIKQQGTTVILTTQLLEEMDEICDKVVILYNKKIVYEGLPSKIKAKYKAKNLNDVFEKIFSGKIDMSEKKNKDEIKDIKQDKPEQRSLSQETQTTIMQKVNEQIRDVGSKLVELIKKEPTSNDKPKESNDKLPDTSKKNGEKSA